MDDGNTFNCTETTIQIADLITGFEITRVDPFTIGCVEGMFRRRFDQFAVDGQMDDDRVVVDVSRGDNGK